MTINVEYFGYGVGLVLVGWFIGICVRLVFNVFQKIGSL